MEQKEISAPILAFSLPAVGVEAAAAADIPTWMVIDLVEPTERARSLASRIATSLLDIRDELRTLIETRQS